MLIELLNRLKENGISRLVYTDSDILPIISKIYSKEESTQIDDVRSAAFYAFGQSKMLGNPVALVINEAFISSTYTALTEVWFQRIPLLVITYNSTCFHATEYLERCVEKQIIVQNKNEIEDTVKSLNGLYGVCLVRVHETLESEKTVDYTDIFSAIKKSGVQGKVICYHTSEPLEGVENILPMYKYGILSKYMGFLCGGQNAILCVPDYVLKYDSNSFGLRDLPCNLLVFVKVSEENEINRFRGWIESNGITVYEKNDFLNIEKLSTPSIIICKS